MIPVFTKLYRWLLSGKTYPITLSSCRQHYQGLLLDCIWEYMKSYINSCLIILIILNDLTFSLVPTTVTWYVPCLRNINAFVSFFFFWNGEIMEMMANYFAKAPSNFETPLPTSEKNWYYRFHRPTQFQ